MTSELTSDFVHFTQWASPACTFTLLLLPFGRLLPPANRQTSLVSICCFQASLNTWLWFADRGCVSFLNAHCPYFFFYRSHFASVKIFFTLSLRRPSLASKWCSSKERRYKCVCVCVWDKIGDNVNERKEAVCRSVTIRKSLHWSRIITAEKPKNREFPSPSPKKSRLMWSSQLLLFFLLYLEFLLLVSEPITSCLDLLTRTSASRYCRCHGRILCLFLLCSSFILVGRPVLVSHFPWGFLLLPSPALCSNVLHLLPPPPSTLPPLKQFVFVQVQPCPISNFFHFPHAVACFQILPALHCEDEIFYFLAVSVAVPFAFLCTGKFYVRMSDISVGP